MELESALAATFGILLVTETIWFLRAWQRNKRRTPRFRLIKIEHVSTRGWREVDDK